MAEPSETERLRQVLRSITPGSGVDALDYDPDLLARRVKARIDELELSGLDGYLDLLRQDAAESERLSRGLTVNVSWFFRDPVVFGVIGERVLSRVVRRVREQGGAGPRIWCAGCAAGHEAWSIGALLLEELRKTGAGLQPLVFGTDINPSALDVATAGVYGPDALESVPVGLLDRHFDRVGEGFEVSASLRTIVHFSVDDLTSRSTSAPPASIYGGFDLVLCRNVILYLGRDARTRVLKKIRAAMIPGGFLVLGASESLGPSNEREWEPFDPANRIYRRAGPPGGRGARTW